MKFLGLTTLVVTMAAQPAWSADLSCNQSGDQAAAVYRAKDGRELAACFDLKQQRVALRLPDGLLVQLPVAVSGSGARYSDGTRTFWEHQGGGRYFVGDTLLFEGALAEAAPIHDVRR